MRARLFSFVLALVTAAAVAQLPAQQPAKGKGPQPDKIYTSASDIAAI